MQTKNFSYRTTLLNNGRTLGYAEYGSPGGRPVLFFHGAPGSSLLHDDMAETARSMNLRLIAVDRPGYGASTADPQMSLTSFADDAVELCDRLGIARFSVIGFSGGSLYSLACAANHASRVDAVIQVATLAPLNAPGIKECLPEMIWGLYEMARTDPAGLQATFSALAPTPEALFATVCASTGPRDQDILQPRKAGLELEYARCLQQGVAGICRDYEVIARDWEIDLRKITAPVHLWNGTADQNTPTAMSRYIASQVAKSDLHILADEGHFILYPHWKEILGQLV